MTVQTLTPEVADTRIRHRVLESATSLLAERGFDGFLLREAAARAGCPLRQADLYFQRNEDLVLALYVRLAAGLEALLPDLPPGRLAERFRFLMEAKLALVAPHREALAAILGRSLDPRDELGVLDERTEIVRCRVLAVFAEAVSGAVDRPSGGVAAMARLLHGAHLAILLLWVRDRTPGARTTREAVDHVCRLLSAGAPLLRLASVRGLVGGLDRMLAPLLDPRPDPARNELAVQILRLLFRHRRLQPGAGECAVEPCPDCLAPHLPRMRRFLAAGEPVHFVLPAFPAKSPNLRKVLGALPDKAEELALTYLENVCAEIREIHSPGARITLCSDGRVFSDLVGVSDGDVTRYGREIDTMIARLGARSLNTFRLEDLIQESGYGAMRDRLCAFYAEPVETIEERARAHEHHRELCNGIHRFLFEDRAAAEPTGSRNRLREECKSRAYQVVRRSEAWGRLVGECFPAALRLSIHPQLPHSEKIGILLGEADDSWLTPWHGVAVERQGTFKLMRRHEAEALGARMVEKDGSPSHCVLEARS